MDGIATQIKYLCKSQVSGYRNANYVLYVAMAEVAVAPREKGEIDFSCRFESYLLHSILQGDACSRIVQLLVICGN